ncbi:hypothetical protein DNU06_05700 [Putridiphycobacter roseus]|uniref:Type IX secretion system membrane protein PorP/SprF n=1 Tax=Putridiphycobacter roseus TaxID=2219161 RepID=A0A2W1N3G7_9FLAO|nr:hypothetical protein [Putridiphycobacter roseus]PZE18110.1 hypothetical protein DNU06_05700 [Putridiphycobacter roseus]
MKKFLIIALAGITTQVSAQTYGNMPFTTPQVSNPAFIALNETPQLNVYSKFGKMFNSQYIGYNRYAPKLKGSFGVYYNGFNSNYNDLYRQNRNNIGLSYARLFSINDKWKYAIGAGFDFAASGSAFNGETSFNYDLGFNVGGVLYADKFFTGINYGNSIHGVANFAWRTGYKLQPFHNKDFSLTPMLTINQFGGHTELEGNLNIAYKKVSLNLGYNYGGYNAGISYDFKRFKLNYTIGNMFSIDEKQIYHEGGIQFKLNKKHQGGKDVKFNHRLF